MEQRCLLRIRERQENSGNMYGSGGVLTEGLRSMELRNKETLVSRVGLDGLLDCSSERRTKQRGHKLIQTVQGLLRSGDDRLENQG